MLTEHNIRLTAAEIGSLWTQYLGDSLATCTIGYFIEKTEDTQILPVLQQALKLAQSHVQKITDLLSREGFPIPIGFTGSDVTLTTPRLFSDPFHLFYIKNLAKSGMIAYSLALSLASRSDVRSFYLENLKTAADLDEMATTVMQNKGLYVRPPYITAGDQAEFAQSTDFLGSFLGEEQRRLSATEIMHLFLNAQSNGIAKALLRGFSQVAQSSELRQIFDRGVNIADKHVMILNGTLKKSEIPGPMTLDTDITASTVPPFSDKLMAFHIYGLMNMVIGYYAAAIGATMRKDISLDYNRLILEVEKYAYELVIIIINNGWAEEPPMAVDRKQLVSQPL
ncbi:MAG: DUF3231 family protein [bacterium]